MRALAVTAALCVGLIWGMAAVRFAVFPYPQLRAVVAPLIPDGPVPQDLQAAARQSLFAQLPPGRADIVFLGDSLTRQGLWSEQFPDAAIANRGIDGDLTGDILARVGPLERTGARTIYLMAGINDLIEGRSVVETAGTLRDILRALAAQGHDVVVQSVLPCDPAACGVAPERIAALNARLAEVAAAEGAVWLDLTPAFPRAALPQLTHDGLHLTGAGYRAWADAVSAAGGP
jgi:lysophospholipase L1-like esterase